jgi:hypothetical protein
MDNRTTDLAWDFTPVPGFTGNSSANPATRPAARPVARPVMSAGTE